MLQQPEYLAWALRHFARAQYNLASSGIAPLTQSELGMAPCVDGSDHWERLRAAIAQYHGLSSEEAVGALGASHGLWLGYTAMISHGDEVLVEDPAYEPMVTAAHAAGAVVRRFDRGRSCGFAVDPDRVFAALTPRTRIVAITNLHNPSGIRASDEAMSAIARRMDERGGFLFVDEVYAPFDQLVGPDGLFSGTARRLGPNVVVTSSLSKVYGLGPQRVGWVLGPEVVMKRATDALIASLGELPLSWMQHGIAAFGHITALAARTRALLGTKRARVGEWVGARAALTWSNPQDGLFGLVILPSAGNVRAAIEMGIAHHDVIVAPGEFFGIPNAFRIGWSLPENLLGEALDRLDRVLLEAGLI